MSEFEKAEMLKERANVSFEEARDALRACNGKLADAYDLIEKRKKAAAAARAAAEASYNNNYYNNTYGPCVGCRYNGYSNAGQGNAAPTVGESFWSLIKTLFRKSVETDLVVSSHGIEKFRLPVLAFVILLMFFNGAVLVAMVVSLFLGVTYSFAGHGDLSKVNRVMNDMGNRASRWYENNCHVSYETQELCRKYDAMDEQNR